MTETYQTRRSVSVGTVRAIFAVAIVAWLSIIPVKAQPKTGIEEALKQVRQNAETLRNQAESDACGKSKCALCSCEGRARTLQSLVEAEALLDAMQKALIEQEADYRRLYFDAVANSRLTGVKLEQLQRSLAWQEFFHKLGSYLLKLESILNTINKNIGSFDIKGVAPGKMDTLQALESLDNLANLAKNLADIEADLSVTLSKESFRDVAKGIRQWRTGTVKPSKSAAPKPDDPIEPKEALNLGWDGKGLVVDILKVVRETRKAYADGGITSSASKLKDLRNLRTLVARTLKIYSAQKLKAEKEIERQMLGDIGPEAKAISDAFKAWQDVKPIMQATEDALSEIRSAITATTESMSRSGCGSSTISRPVFGPFNSYGEALPTLEGRLIELPKGLATGIKNKDNCREDPETSSTDPKTKRPSKNVIPNDCPQCSGIAMELGKTLDERDFVASEIIRINLELETVVDLEKKAELHRDAIKRLSDLIRDFRDGRRDRNALKKAADALFDLFGLKAEREIDIVVLEAERTRQQNDLRTVERKIRSIKLEGDKLPQLNKENLRLYDLSESLRGKLAGCQSLCKVGENACKRPLTEQGAIACIEALILKLQVAYDARTSELGDRPYFRECETRKDSIFAEAGVKADWGSVCTSWDGASRFYWQHRANLVNSKLRIENTHRFSDADIKYLEDGFVSWSKAEAEFGRLVSGRWDHLKILSGYQRSWEDAVKRTRASKTDEERVAAERAERSAYDTHTSYFTVIQNDNRAIRAFGDRIVFTSVPR